jgi:hypothetical protein
MSFANSFLGINKFQIVCSVELLYELLMRVYTVVGVGGGVAPLDPAEKKICLHLCQEGRRATTSYWPGNQQPLIGQESSTVVVSLHWM